MKHASLFSGIGGFDLAAQWMGWENIFQVEIDPFCQKVLTKNFPNVTRYGDIKQFDGTKYRGTIDILSGGFPCQPFSSSGSRKGTNDARFLWPEMLRVSREVGPSFIVGENVSGITSLENGRTLERILIDLESIGYTIEAFLIPAASVGAWHRRDRVWIVANRNGEPWDLCKSDERAKETHSFRACSERIFADVEHERRQEQWSAPAFKSNPIVPSIQRPTKSGMVRRVYGIPNRVDRIKSLGNAIVPQVAFEIFKAIAKTV